MARIPYGCYNKIKSGDNTAKPGSITVFSIGGYIGVEGRVEIAFNWDEFMNYYDIMNSDIMNRKIK